MIKETYYEGVYDCAKIEKGAVIFDVGAHIGIYSLKVAENSSLVVAFEPHPGNFDILLSNIHLNGFKNIIAYKCALSDFYGKTRLYLSEDSGQHSILEGPRGKSWLEVPVKTIKTVMNKLGLEEIDVLKIDAEGAELSILKGAEEKILNIRQIVCAAYHMKHEADEIEDYLSSKNFKTIRLEHNNTIFTYSFRAEKL